MFCGENISTIFHSFIQEKTILWINIRCHLNTDRYRISPGGVAHTGKTSFGRIEEAVGKPGDKKGD